MSDLHTLLARGRRVQFVEGLGHDRHATLGAVQEVQSNDLCLVAVDGTDLVKLVPARELEIVPEIPGPPDVKSSLF